MFGSCTTNTCNVNSNGSMLPVDQCMNMCGYETIRCDTIRYGIFTYADELTDSQFNLAHGGGKKQKINEKMEEICSGESVLVKSPWTRS